MAHFKAMCWMICSSNPGWSERFSSSYNSNHWMQTVEIELLHRMKNT